MKLKAILFIGFAAILSSCSYEPGATGQSVNSPFKKDFTASYDISSVDTAGTGHTADAILTAGRVSAQEITVDTGVTYKGKSGVARIVTFTTPTPDTNYFYQDANGNLYRYNFGFTILNQFPYLVTAFGSNIDVGWVLAAKMNSTNGTTWTARDNDTLTIQGFNVPVVLSSQGIVLADTTFTIGTSQVKAKHMRNTVTATAIGFVENGEAVIDSYYSADLGAVVEDYFHHVNLAGQLLNQQAQGKFKIMTSHQ
jgi:hypothetical protein